MQEPKVTDWKTGKPESRLPWLSNLVVAGWVELAELPKNNMPNGPIPARLPGAKLPSAGIYGTSRLVNESKGSNKCGKGSIKMSGWVFVAVPAAALVILLVHDFMAGLGEDRLWADPSVSDSESFRNRSERAERMYPEAVSMDSIGKLADLPRKEDSSATTEKPQARPA